MAYSILPPIALGVSIFSLVVAVAMNVYLAWRRKQRNTTRGNGTVAFKTEGQGKTTVIGGKVTGYDRVSETTDQGKFHSEGTKVTGRRKSRWW